MRTLPIFIILLGIITINSCSKDPETDSDDQTQIFTDNDVLEEIRNNTLFFYQGDTATLSAAGNSPHGTFKLLFNQTALDALGADGKLAAGETFPTGSLVVKDVIRNGTTSFYAAMWKQPSAENANEDWLWYEAFLDGSLLVSIDAKGSGCIGCHRANTNRDFVNSFDLH